MKVLVTGPDLYGKGGVSVYLNSVLPYLKKFCDVDYLQVGKKKDEKFYFIKDQINFYKKLKNNNFDLIHINPSLNLKSFIRDGLLAFQAKKLKKKLLVFFHGWDKNFENLIDNNLILQKFFKTTFGKADAFIVLASDFKEKLIKWGIDAPIFLETTTLEDSLLKDFDIYKKLQEINSIQKFNFLYLARLEKDKGIIEAIEIFEYLRKNGIKGKLIIAGDGPAKNLMLERILKSAYKNDIRYVGFVTGDKKKKLLENAHIYLLPTYEEGLPTSVLEAMFFGCFIITTNVGGLKDLWKKHKWGICLGKDDIKNSNLILKKISEYIEFIKNIFFLRKYMLSNHNFAKNNFNPNFIAKKVMKIYNQCVR